MFVGGGKEVEVGFLKYSLLKIIELPQLPCWLNTDKCKRKEVYFWLINFLFLSYNKNQSLEQEYIPAVAKTHTIKGE